MIEMILVEGSSNIKAIGWEPVGPTLRVAFHSGSTWEYEGVPEYKYQGMLNAESKGKYFNAEVKGHYLGRKVA